MNTPLPLPHFEFIIAATPLRAALWYVTKKHWFVIPLHTPLFDGNGLCTGCSCEAHKRSRKYLDWLDQRGQGAKFDPKFKCRYPGKHPRLFDWEQNATTDPAIIRQWWQKWPNANVGIAAGKSGLLMFDADSYKQHYGDLRSLLSPTECHTITALSGGGGEHLVYRMPLGEYLGNHEKGLPPGVNVRGHGGQFVAAPSIHPSGRYYAWEENYRPSVMDAAPLPPSLHEILRVANMRANMTISFSDDISAPDLNRLALSPHLRRLIIEGHAQDDDRSHGDWAVIRSLVDCGCSDDQIRAIYQKYMIGTAGKYADPKHGDAYLALSIQNARHTAKPRRRVAVIVRGGK